MRSKTRVIALGGIVIALTFALCWMGSVSMGFKFIAPAICGILLMILYRPVFGKTAVVIYVASSLLLLLLPNRISAFAYIGLLGYYPVLCISLEKLPVWLQLLLKLVLFTAVGGLMLLAGAGTMGLWNNQKFLQYFPWMIAGFYFMGAVYDGFLWLLRRRFALSWDAKLEKVLNMRGKKGEK